MCADHRPSERVLIDIGITYAHDKVPDPATFPPFVTSDDVTLEGEWELLRIKKQDSLYLALRWLPVSLIPPISSNQSLSPETSPLLNPIQDTKSNDNTSGTYKDDARFGRKIKQKMKQKMKRGEQQVTMQDLNKSTRFKTPKRSERKRGGPVPASVAALSPPSSSPSLNPVTSSPRLPSRTPLKDQISQNQLQLPQSQHPQQLQPQFGAKPGTPPGLLSPHAPGSSITTSFEDPGSPASSPNLRASPSFGPVLPPPQVLSPSLRIEEAEMEEGVRKRRPPSLVKGSSKSNPRSRVGGYLAKGKKGGENIVEEESDERHNSPERVSDESPIPEAENVQRLTSPSPSPLLISGFSPPLSPPLSPSSSPPLPSTKGDRISEPLNLREATKMATLSPHRKSVTEPVSLPLQRSSPPQRPQPQKIRSSQHLSSSYSISAPQIEEEGMFDFFGKGFHGLRNKLSSLKKGEILGRERDASPTHSMYKVALSLCSDSSPISLYPKERVPSDSLIEFSEKQKIQIDSYRLNIPQFEEIKSSFSPKVWSEGQFWYVVLDLIENDS